MKSQNGISVKIVDLVQLPSTYIQGFQNPILRDAWDKVQKLEKGKAIVLTFEAPLLAKRASNSLAYRRRNENKPEIRIKSYGKTCQVALWRI